VRGINSEELRAFLSSLLVQPHKTKTVADWLKTWQGQHIKPGPAAVTKGNLQH
jgi:hypothetical protein